MEKRKIVLSAVAAALVLSVGGVTAFAAVSDTFSYLIGRQRSTSRNELYEQAAELPEDEQNAFLAENGIADTPYSEEAAASYSYVTGQQVGSLYEDDTEDKTGYSYITGQEAGASYAPEAKDEDVSASNAPETGNVSASKAPEAEDGSAYSYLAGQQNSTNRNDLYAQAQELPEDEQDAFLAENGIGETPWSEEAAASYSYVTGQQRGASFRQDDDADSTQDMSGYSYLTGQQRGASYHK